MQKLKSSDVEKIVAAYEARLAEHGFDVEALKSGGHGKQFARHSLHANLFDLSGRSVLDVGCGIGMFYRFLRNRGVPFGDYTGIDIVEPFLDYDRRMYPEARFLTFDIGSDPVEPLKPDVVFMSQIFNARYAEADNEAFAKHVVERFFKGAREGLVVDFMSSYVDYREQEHHYFLPEAMLTFAKSLTPYVALHHDYLRFEFTLVLRHSPVLEPQESEQMQAYA